MSGREPAWRMFAQELGATTEEERGRGERAASYVISPLGARANRVLIAGRIGAPESVGREPSAPFFRAMLADPTGSVIVTAGGFQPGALAAMQRQRPDEVVLIVGKPSLYQGPGGSSSPSIRVEAMRRIDSSEYQGWLAETLDQTLERIDLLRGRGLGPAGAAIPAMWAAGARAALERYPAFDVRGLREGLRRAMAELTGEAAPERPGAPAAPAHVAPPAPSPVASKGARITRAPPPPARRAPPSAAGRAEEAAFLDVVDELSELSADGYADLREAIGLAGRRGVSPTRAEELVNSLEENGALEEPLVGKIRRA